MKNLYEISKWQFILLWVFSVIAWVRVANNSCEWFQLCRRFGSDNMTPLADWMALIIPFVLVFYTLGWISHQKKIKE